METKEIYEEIAQIKNTLEDILSSTSDTETYWQNLDWALTYLELAKEQLEQEINTTTTIKTTGAALLCHPQ